MDRIHRTDAQASLPGEQDTDSRRMRLDIWMNVLLAFTTTPKPPPLAGQSLAYPARRFAARR